MNIDERNILLLAFNQKNQTKKGVAQMSEHKTHVIIRLYTKERSCLIWAEKQNPCKKAFFHLILEMYAKRTRRHMNKAISD